LDAAHDSDVLVVEDVPHELLFGRVAGAVHHGGAGTTHTALAAGIPAVVVPFFADQPFWGRRIATIGAGPAPIPRRAVTPGRLSGAITEALDPPMRHRAASLGEQVRAEPGTRAAVPLLERIMTDRAGRDTGRTSRG
jgi:UDP:flavonoid glycosyltransferase YjiC (YdhE family)